LVTQKYVSLELLEGPKVGVQTAIHSLLIIGVSCPKISLYTFLAIPSSAFMLVAQKNNFDTFCTLRNIDVISFCFHFPISVAIPKRKINIPELNSFVKM